MENNADPNVMDDIHQSPLYASFAQSFPLFSEGPHGVCDIRVCFGVCADRASLSKQKLKHSFAILPVLLSIVNWPLWIRCQEKYLLLTSVPPMHEKNPTIALGSLQPSITLLQTLMLNRDAVLYYL
jgi:hypothetical protein